MTAYVVVDAKVTDPVKYKDYQLLSPEAITAGGGEFLVRGGEHTILEGVWNPSRLVIVKFPTVEAAKSFYDSALYRVARAKRDGATEFFNMVVVQGV
jgi:uncharacterized protein (DUF1330 family)